MLDASKIYKPKPTPNPQKSRKSLVASNTVASPASIVELARALKNDPQLIFEHVYNNIDWEPTWGVQKGPLGALLAGMGGSFDQSMLLVELLREAGFTAQYVMGQIDLSETECDDWFNTAHVFAAYYYLQYANIPGSFPYWSGTEWRMAMAHVWVEVVVGGTTYSLDPSRKTYTRKAAVSGLDTILGYSQSTFLSNAASGATIDPSGDFIQNMNTTNIHSDLATMTSNLISYIDGNSIGSASAGTATVDDVLGGQEIVPLTLPFTWSTSLPYEAPGDVPTIWTGDVPLAYKTTLQVQYPDSLGGWAIDETFTSDQLAGAELTLTFDGSLYPLLKLNGVLIAPVRKRNFQEAGIRCFLTVNHNAYAFTVYPAVVAVFPVCG
ncbi:MAG: transglutaminase family protein [Candidatus Obscuribacter sp.]|nr:transglutaminase family protein [Candidatus Obscuribacter sp.]